MIEERGEVNMNLIYVGIPIGLVLSGLIPGTLSAEVPSCYKV